MKEFRPHVFQGDRFGRKGGFSLIEMLIVMSVLGVLMALAAPNLFTLMQASGLTSDGEFIRNKLTQAQQLALSKNADVEVRFFKMADASAAEFDEKYRGVQFFQFNERGKLEPVSRFFRIKPPVVVSEELSTLLTPNQGNSEDQEYGFISPSTGVGEVPSTGFGTSQQSGVEYTAFRFRPDGSTDLPGRARGGSDTWYLTLVKGENEAGGVPDNYFTIQVDPFNGKVAVFRP